MIQLEMIERVKLLARETPAISAVLMYGSFVKGEGDEYSDIEFYIFLNPEIDFNKRSWIDSIEKIELLFVNEFGTEVAVFENLVRGEFHFMSVGQVGIINSWIGLVSFEYWEDMILVDKDSQLLHVFEGINKDRPHRDAAENMVWLQSSLINTLLFTKNLLLRGEWAHAHQNFFYIHRYLLWLTRIKAASTIHWESPTKKLEKDLPAIWYRKYSECIPSLDKDNLNRAFLRCVKLTRELFEYHQSNRQFIDILSRITGKV